MAGRRLAQKTLDRYGAAIAQLLGVQQQAVNFVFDPNLQSGSTDNRVAQGDAATGTVTLDRSWLKAASRQDVRGAVIHELAHTFGAGSETQADYARWKLNPHEAGYWKPTAEVRAYDAPGEVPVTQPNGPRGAPTRPGGRVRNTWMNQLSKATPPPLPPGAVASATSQMAALQQQYGAAVAGSRVAIGAARGTRKTALADIRANAIASMGASEGDALSRGIVGSSADLGARSGVLATAAGQKVDALNASAQDIALARIQEMQAQSDLNLGIAGVQSNLAAQQSELANQRYESDLLTTQQADFAAMYKAALAKLLARGKNPPGATVAPTGDAAAPPTGAERARRGY